MNTQHSGIPAASHTPGPWTLHESERGIRVEDSSATVCHVFNRWEKDGNARLIAAAPELLAALHLARRYIRLSDPTTCTPAEAAVLEQIDAAIAEAEGK